MVRSSGLWLLVAVAAATAAATKAERPLASRSSAEILDHYTFAGDFSEHESARPIANEIFWRYPFSVPKIEFPLHGELDDPKVEMPATRGSGRSVDHLNRGRLLYLEGKFTEAKATWLAGRARFGNTYPFHRRNDYFIGYSFLGIAKDLMTSKHLDYDNHEIRSVIANAGTFLSWAFIVKADQPDPLVEAATPKALYNLAALYWRYGRYGGAFGAADSGLNFLRKTGRKEFRPQFHRLLAEAHIKNRSYLEAVQELDTAIRQDRDRVQAAASFARVGDIYFDLNNYELAEDAYALGAKLDEEAGQINQAQLVLRGEALFWLGQFSEAQKVMHFALEGANYVNKVSQPLGEDYAAWASLRIADAYLARHQWEDAKLAYFKVGHQFRSLLPGRIAKVREACLDLPFYKGHNIEHARSLLEEAKTQVDLPLVVKELGWACQVASYTSRERTPEMLERVKAFAVAHPESAFLKDFVDPVREFQATHIDEYFSAGDTYSALSFFERTRRNLFPRVKPELARQLFVAYADIHQARKAAEFWDAYNQAPDSDLKVLRQVVVSAEELARRHQESWEERDRAFASRLEKRHWTLPPAPLALNYVERLQAASPGPRHLVWLSQLARRFGEQDSAYICDLEYPLLSRLHEHTGRWREMAAKRDDELIKNLLPTLFQHDESCALSLLDLEAYHLKQRGAEAVAAAYLQRADWPLVAGFLHVYWTMAEYVYDAGAKSSARKLWEVIRSKGTPGSPEVEFATARLDQRRTEFEKMWD